MKTKEELETMSKRELEAYGRTLDLELDRRLNKNSLIDQLLDVQPIDANQNVPEIIEVVEDVEEVVEIEVPVSPVAPVSDSLRRKRWCAMN